MPHILLGHSMFLVWYPNQPDLSLWMLVYGQVSKTIVYCQHSCNHLWLFQYAQNYQKWPTDYLGQLLSMWSTECCVSNFLWKCFFLESLESSDRISLCYMVMMVVVVIIILSYFVKGDGDILTVLECCTELPHRHLNSFSGTCQIYKRLSLFTFTFLHLPNI